MFTTAFTDYNAAGIPRFAGVRNFVQVINEMTAHIAADALKTVSVMAFIGFGAALLLACLVNMMPVYLHNFFTIMLVLPALSNADLVLSALGFLAITGGMRNVPLERFEAARLEGMRNRMHELVHITFPAIRPQLIFAAILQTAAAFALGALKLGVHEYSGVFRLGQASAVYVLVFAVMLAVYFVIRRCGRCTD